MKIIHGDSLEKLKDLPDNSVDSVCTDPPYGISFMGKKWDYDVPQVELWKEVLRVLKPGGHALVACGTRTQHRMAVNLEDAGFEIRDIVAWVYGSGFPKSLNIGKAVDKLQGNEREETHKETKADSTYHTQNVGETIKNTSTYSVTKGTSPYEGWGTALKPSMELWTLCRKPLEEKTVAQNVLKYGTGGINIDESRVETSDKYSYPNGAGGNSFSVGEEPDGKRTEPVESNTLGRFPANLILEDCEEVRGCFPETKGGGSQRGSRKWKGEDGDGGFGGWAGKVSTDHYISRDDGTGSAARFFYCAKASKSERNKGLDGKPTAPKANFHPTVKPVKLMQYLCRLITPKYGTILDPFMGSGTTGIGAKLEGFDFIGIEREEDYVKIAEARINAYD